MALLAEVLKGCRDLVYLFNLIPKDSLGELEQGTAVLSKVQVTPCRANQVAQETISPEMGLTADPSQGFSEKAGTCSLHLAILQQTTYCTGRARARARALRCHQGAVAQPSAQVSSHAHRCWYQD